MNKVYVVGHKNPDTDTVVSAIAYTALRNAMGEREYSAAYLDHIPDGTLHTLNRYGFEAPERIHNVYTQVCDLDFDTPPALHKSVTMDRAWREMQEHKLGHIPVINEDGSLYGLLSDDHIAEYNMQSIVNYRVENIPLFNLQSVLEGQMLNESCTANEISGEVCIALPQNCDAFLFSKKESIVICGSQPDMIRRALDLGAACVILCETEIDPEWIKDAGETCILSTPFDACRTVRLIFQALPIARRCRTENITCFHLNDYIDTVREKMSESREHCYPVLDANDKVIGTLSRYHLMKPRRKQVVLVDHNEMAQAVPGLEEADIIAIIDHHRLGDIQTRQPVRVRNEPVGSTTTIIAELFREHGVIPSPNLAGLMAAAILTDTVMFKSPTSTKLDKVMAERMARIAGISLEDIGLDLFAGAVSPDASAEEIILSDFKEFHIAEHFLGVGQVTCYDSENLLSRQDELLKKMKELRDQRKYDFILLMVTDVLLEGTQLLFVGGEEIISHAFNVENIKNPVFLPCVMSRKKQIIPTLTALWG